MSSQSTTNTKKPMEKLPMGAGLFLQEEGILLIEPPRSPQEPRSPRGPDLGVAGGSKTRALHLMRMMEDMHVVENRGSGITTMLQAMRQAHLEPPRFDDRRASFQVTFRNYTLMNPEAIAWLNQFAHVQLNDRQRLALVYLRQHESITNGDYRRLNRVDAMMAGQELRGLVQAGLVDQQGASRWTSYTLRISREHVAQGTRPTDEEIILAYVREHGSINNAECRRLLGIEDKRAWYLLNKLCNLDRVQQVGKGRWSRHTLP